MELSEINRNKQVNKNIGKDVHKIIHKFLDTDLETRLKGDCKNILHKNANNRYFFTLDKCLKHLFKKQSSKQSKQSKSDLLLKVILPEFIDKNKLLASIERLFTIHKNANAYFTGQNELLDIARYLGITESNYFELNGLFYVMGVMLKSEKSDTIKPLNYTQSIKYISDLEVYDALNVLLKHAQDYPFKLVNPKENRLHSDKKDRKDKQEDYTWYTEKDCRNIIEVVSDDKKINANKQHLEGIIDMLHNPGLTIREHTGILKKIQGWINKCFSKNKTDYFIINIDFDIPRLFFKIPYIKFKLLNSPIPLSKWNINTDHKFEQHLSNRYYYNHTFSCSLFNYFNTRYQNDTQILIGICIGLLPPEYIRYVSDTNKLILRYLLSKSNNYTSMIIRKQLNTDKFMG